MEKKRRLLNPHERRVVPITRCVIRSIATALPGTDPIQKVSIIPRGVGALGCKLERPTDDRFLMSRSQLMDKMAVLLGGRAAESLIFDKISIERIRD